MRLKRENVVAPCLEYATVFFRNETYIMGNDFIDLRVVRRDLGQPYSIPKRIVEGGQIIAVCATTRAELLEQSPVLIAVRADVGT